MKRKLSRRRFFSNGLRYGAAAWAGGVLAGAACGQSGNKGKEITAKPRVIVARDDALSPEPNTFQRDVGVRMLDSAVMKLVKADSPEKGWSSLFTSEDVVGIKINCLAGPQLSSHPGLVDVIVDGVRKAGVSPSNIHVFDRMSRELQDVGFKVRKGAGDVRFQGTDELSYGGYEANPTIFRSVASRFSMFVSRICTALINVPVLKDHDIAGVSIGMKNFLGAIDNPNKYHDDNGNPYISDLNHHPYIARKLRLVVCDAVRVQYDGGPSFKPSGVWDYSGLLVTRDPVALDATGMRLIEQKRAEAKRPPLAAVGRPPKYIQTAAELGLGVADPSGIEIVEL